jgi:ribosomal protein S18 acetylase RimI-like enzyme
MAEVELRACQIDDIEAVLGLWRRAGVVPLPTDRPDALHRRLERDPELFVLAWDGPTLVGSLMGGWDGFRGQMYRLAVDPGYRRRGIARALVDAVELELRRRGCERITSLVFKDEPGAPEFWRDVGYVPDPRIERHAKDLP